MAGSSQLPGAIKVAKFGGTSVATAAQLLKVKAIVDADPARRLIVPSAPGKASKDDTKITDLLYLAQQLGAKKQPLGAVWEQIASRFTGIVRDLGLKLDLAPALAEVRAKIEGGAGPDYAASRGEALHGRVVAALLGAEYVDAAEVVKFDRSGRLDPRTYELIRARCAGGGRYVIPGFYGATAAGEIKTFSRGGSDVTGAVVARACEVALYENWTDVSGVLMTDPRVVAEAKPIGEITYRELRELSYMGASVLHEEAVFPVRDKGIPINIRNTNRPDDAGTMIVAERDAGHQVVVGIAGTKGFTVFNVEKALMNAEIGFGRRVLDVFERLGISFEHTPTGIDTMSVVVSDKQLVDANGASKVEQIVEDIQGAVRPDSVKVVPGMALVATVGQGMNHAIGTAARLFTALAKSRVNVRMIDQGSSEQNIIVGVEENDLGTAIRAIYNEFGLTPRGERLLVGLLTTVQFTNITDFVVMMPLGPQLMRAFDVGPQGFGALVAAYNVSAGLSALVASRLLDRFDRKRALIALYAGFILGTAACAAAPGFAWMMAARVAAGAFGGVLGAVVMAIIGDQIPYERRGAAMGAIMTAFALASVIGVPLGLWASAGWGWHAPFVLVALASLPALALAIIGIPSMRGHIAQAPERGLLAHYGALLGDRGHLAALAMSVALTLGGFLVIPFMATFMSVNVGLGDRQLAYLYLVGGAATIVTARLIGRLADRFGKHRVFVVVALLSLVPVVGLPRLPHLPTAVALAASTVFMILVSGRFIPASALMTATVPAAQRGSFMSLNSAVQALTCGIATTIASAIVVRHGEGPLERYDLVGLLSGAATLVAVWLAGAVHASVEGRRALTPAPPTPDPR